MKIDTKDKHLVFLLDQNSRASLTELVSKLRLSREAVNYRIKRLVKACVIDSFLTKLSFGKLGFVNYIAYLKLNNLDPKQYKQFVEDLTKKKEITWVASLGGRFDLAVEMTATGVSQFDRHFSNLLDEHPDNISNYFISTRVFQHSYGRKYLWPEIVGKKKAELISEEVEQIDDLDRKIISALATDARLPVVDLSNRIKEAPSTVSFRLKQLINKGIVEGFMTFPKIQNFGYHGFKTLLTVRNFSRADEQRLGAFCKTHPNVYYYTKTLGSWNFEMEVDVKTPAEYQQFLIDFRSRFSDFIQNIESLSIFEEHKFTFWPE
jgi:Lrp/AsnC family leucine-responsive transcriptional regulator